MDYYDNFVANFSGNGVTQVTDLDFITFRNFFNGGFRETRDAKKISRPMGALSAFKNRRGLWLEQGGAIFGVEGCAGRGVNGELLQSPVCFHDGVPSKQRHGFRVGARTPR